MRAICIRARLSPPPRRAIPARDDKNEEAATARLKRHSFKMLGAQ